MAKEANVVRRGIYNVDYYSGSQVSLFVGDIWVDEITSLDYSVMQNRIPIYGYASTLFDDVTEGHVLVQGTFTINFKEAGYLWLILQRYKDLIKSKSPKHDDPFSRLDDPFSNKDGKYGSAATNRDNIERIINNEGSVLDRNRALQDIAHSIAQAEDRDEANAWREEQARLQADRVAELAASLQGYSSNTRASGGIGRAENIYEAFEDAVWGMTPKELDEDLDRRTDSPLLNPFDIYVTFGDFAGDNSANHTIERIRDVYLLGKGKRIEANGIPISEAYQFIARNLV